MKKKKARLCDEHCSKRQRIQGTEEIATICFQCILYRVKGADRWVFLIFIRPHIATKRFINFNSVLA